MEKNSWQICKKILKYEIIGVDSQIKLMGFTIKFRKKKVLLNKINLLEEESQGLRQTEKSLNNLVNEMEMKNQQFITENQKLMTEKQEFMTENQKLMTEKQEFMTENQKLITEKQEFMTENQKLMTEKQKLMAEKQEFMTENQRLMTEKQEFMMENQKSTIENQKLLEQIKFLQEKYDSQETQLTVLTQSQQTEKLEFDQFKARYMKAIWCTGWIEKWKEYYCRNYLTIQDKINGLLENVDEQSKLTIKLFLERNFKIFPEQKYASLFLYDHDNIFQDWEISGMQAGLPDSEIREKYKIDNDVYLETPVFQFHCGLKLLEAQVLKRIKNHDIIDGGAFWGDSMLIFEDYAPRSIQAFEPMPINYNNLCKTIEKNNLENVVPIQAGLGNKQTNTDIFYHEMLSGASVIQYKAILDEKPEIHQNSIEIRTIDQYVNEKNLDVGLIKLDVEGSELETIIGAVDTIRKYKPILLISVYHMPKDLFEIKPLLEGMNLGYKFMFRKLCFHDPLTEVSLIGFVS